MKAVKLVPVEAGVSTDPMQQKAELATKAIDMLMFSGQVGAMVASMATMAGIPEVSISLILPTKNKDNLRPFLASLNSTISTVLDDQVSLDEFTGVLVENIKRIKAIAEEEK